jgi:O-antigen/teichoic acid export membrane protein
MRKFGVPLALGLVQSTEFAGLFYWGFTLSVQVVFLFGASLTKVLFPAFTQINADGQRQSRAFASASQLLVALVAPLCILQATLVDDVLQVLGLERWMATAGVVRWLSLGMLAEPFAVLANSVLMARGRFRLVGAISLVSALGTMGLAALSALAGSLTLVAVAVAVGALLTAGTSLVFAVRALGGVSVGVFGPAAACCAAAGLAGVLGWMVQGWLGQFAPMARVATDAAAICGAYLLSLQLVAPGFLRSLLARMAYLRAPFNTTPGPI